MARIPVFPENAISREYRAPVFPVFPAGFMNPGETGRERDRLGSHAHQSQPESWRNNPLITSP